MKGNNIWYSDRDSTLLLQDAKCGSANLLFHAFEKLGLFLLSDSLQENTACDTLIDVTHLGGRVHEVDEPVALPVAFSFAAAPPPVVQNVVQESFETAEDQPAQVLIFTFNKPNSGELVQRAQTRTPKRPFYQGRHY